MDDTRWEHFSHVGDIGVRGFGPTREVAFEQVAVALTATIADPSSVTPSEAVDVACRAPDDGLLLADWLNALIYEMATRKMLFSRFSVKIDGERLTATAWGEPIDVERHQPATEVKGATLTALEVDQVADGGWIAQIVVDV